MFSLQGDEVRSSDPYFMGVGEVYQNIHISYWHLDNSRTNVLSSIMDQIVKIFNGGGYMIN